MADEPTGEDGMNADQTPFSAAWWGLGLAGIRPCTSTYCQVAYASLPPIDEAGFRGDFSWLTPLDATLDAELARFRPEAEESTAMLERLDLLLAEAAARGVAVPAPFVRFMSDLGLQERIPSPTACFFDLPQQMTPSPFGDDALILRFLTDQQWVVAWHLYLHPDGDHSVVVGPAYDMFEDDERRDPAQRDQLLASTWWCAPSFEAFLYRFWLENSLWFALRDGRALTGAELAYLRHYQRPRPE